MMNRKELIKKYLEFFKSKDHKIIPNASLIPKDDPTVLFTTAGMHPLVPYLLGQKHPLGKRLANVQKCVRTTDIEEVGNNSHHTFIEMLGNWSLGDYWKKETIEYSLEFLTKVLKIPKEKIHVTCFKGDRNAPKDTESAQIWKSLGINKIKFLGKEDNWWGPAGKTGPCGPDTEMFVDNIEIWNDVFMQYNKTEKGKYEPLKQKNVDTGMGVERTIAILNGFRDNYLTEIWQPIIKQIEKLSGKKYKGNEKSMRIIADHLKASVFIIADGIIPSNTQQGYVLRRLIRRAIKYGKDIGITNISKIAESVFRIYDDYPELGKNREKILKEFGKEEERFRTTIEKGMSRFNKLISRKKKLSGKDAFLLYQSYGFPIELTEEMARERKIKIDKRGFDKESEKHQKLSRTATKGVFGSGLADHTEKTIRLHTATHLLNEALRKVLDKNIKQKGSNITPERLRFDFNFDRKLTEKEIKKVENLVNKKISEKIKVTSEEMPLKKALKIAQAEFGARYPDTVSVYSIGNFSTEICTGPHVKNTRDIGKFRIIKEESSAAGVRRIKAVVE
jgi:alanyl-tRNA synthetase